MTWLLMPTGRWHAWHYGGQRSVCSAVRAQDLQEQPAVAVSEELTAPCHEMACRNCARKMGLPSLLDGPAPTRAWLGYLRRHLLRVGGRVAEADLAVLAARLAEVGTPEDPRAREVFTQVQTLLLTPRRWKNQRGTVTSIPKMSDALALLPPNAGALARISAALRCWRMVTGRGELDRFNPAQVIQTMLAIPAIEPYVRHLKSRNLEHLAAVFHPNTLERAKREPALRGVFGGSGEYWERTAATLNVVED